MSKSDKKASVEEQGEVGTDSVFDFLYHDSRRIASYLSQFDNNGLLTGLTQTEGVTKGAKRSKKFGGGVTTPVGGGSLALELGPTDTGSESMVRVYDPYWANALQFLDVLDERRMIQRDLDDANIGQFVLMTGYLSIQDLGMMKEAWALKSLKQKMLGSAGDGKKMGNMTAAQKAQAKEEKENTELFLEMIQLMPHSVHATLLPTDHNKGSLVWGTINQENLATPVSDITLSYGQMMSGEWSILGILSAKPEYMTPDLNGEFDQNDPGFMESIVGQMTKILASIVRVSLGRPAVAHAITPLLVFREVS